MPKTLSVYNRFLGTVLPVCILVFAFAFSLFEWANYKTAKDALYEELDSASSIYSLLIAEPMANGELDKISLLTSYLISNQDISAVTITNSEGNAIETFSSGKSLDKTVEMSVNYATEFGFSKLGKLTISVSEERILSDFKLRLIYEAYLLIGLVAAVLLSVWFAYSVNVGIPLKKLTHAITRYKHMGKHEPIPEGRRDEFGEVIRAYNDMQAMQMDARERLQKYHIELENEVKQRTAELTYQANHDALTGLINRREFTRRLKKTIKQTKGRNAVHALCYMDLDNFKTVNDNCGHAAGDKLLAQIAEIFNTNVREDDCVARLGGDEFALLLDHCSVEGARNVSEQIRRCISDYELQWKHHTFKVGVSIGITCINRKSDDINTILKEADMACYDAKSKGKNQICIHGESDHKVRNISG